MFGSIRFEYEHVGRVLRPRRTLPSFRGRLSSTGSTHELAARQETDFFPRVIFVTFHNLFQILLKDYDVFLLATPETKFCFPFKTRHSSPYWRHLGVSLAIARLRLLRGCSPSITSMQRHYGCNAFQNKSNWVVKLNIF